MLRIETISRSKATYYLELVDPEYVIRGGERPGEWLGEGRQVVKTRHPVDVDGPTFDWLLAGKALTHGHILKNRRAGWDFVLSAPKSVSVLWALADQPLRDQLLSAHRSAVRETLKYIEDCYVTISKGESRQSTYPAQVIFASFEHRTSRESEPLLHTHSILPNVGFRENGEAYSVNSREFFSDQKLLGAWYRAALAAKIERGMGLAVRRVGTSFEIQGVPESHVAIFSTRRRQIVEAIQADGRMAAAGGKYAALKTRESRKSPTLPEDELRQAWAEKAGPENINLKRSVLKHPTRAFQTLYVEALRHLEQNQSQFEKADLLRAMLERAPGHGLAPHDVESQLETTLLTSTSLYRLEPDKFLLTTRGSYATEKRLINDVTYMQSVSGQSVSERRLERMIRWMARPRNAIVEEFKHHGAQIVNAALKKPTQALSRETLRKEVRHVLSDEQAKALGTICGKGSRIRVLDGLAGTAKTSLMRLASGLWKSEGKVVYGVTLAARAARELQEKTGIKSRTLASIREASEGGAVKKFKHDITQVARAAVGLPTRRNSKFRFAKNSIIVVDEAGLISTPNMTWLIGKARRDGAELRFVGDRLQLPEIGAGGGYDFICKTADRVSLSEIHRQTTPGDRKMVQALANGEVEVALERLKRSGRLFVGRDRDEAFRAIVGEWAKQEIAEPRKGAILARTNEEVDLINALCRERRVDAGLVQSKNSVTIRDQDIGVGDWVLFTKTDTDLGMENGTTGIVSAINRGRGGVKVVVVLDHDQDRAIQVSLSDYSDLKPAYARTGHHAQGHTFDRVYLYADGQVSRELLYSAISRASQSAKLFVGGNSSGKNLEVFTQNARVSKKQFLSHELEKPAVVVE
jgi:conjugative relaxase-like TrwC/TraI family protein